MTSKERTDGRRLKCEARLMEMAPRMLATLNMALGLIDRNTKNNVRAIDIIRDMVLEAEGR